MTYHGRYSDQHLQRSKAQMSNLFDMRSQHRGGGDCSFFGMQDYRFNARNTPFSSSSIPYRERFLSNDSSFNGSSNYREDRNPELYGSARLHQDRLLSVSNPNLRNSSAWQDTSHNLESDPHQQEIPDFSQKRSVSSLFDISDPQRSGREVERFGSVQDSYLKSRNNEEITQNPFRQSYQDSMDIKQENTRTEWDREENDFDRNRYRINNTDPYKSNEKKHVNDFKQSLFEQKFQSGGRGRGRRRRFGKNRNPGFQPSASVKQEGVKLEADEENPENNDNHEENEGDNEDGTENDRYEKVNPFIPDKALIDKYQFYPPSAEEMAKLFDDMVIYYIFNAKNIAEKNPFVIICESFRRSAKYANMHVEDGYLKGKTFIKFCTLRWHGMMMVRGVGENGHIKEPRVRAGVELINKLAKSAFTLKMRDEYFGIKFLSEMLKEKERPGVFKVVNKEETPDTYSALAYINNFFKEDSDCELVFPERTKDITSLKWNLRKIGYETRCYTLKDSPVIVVSKRRTPQYWRDKIFESGCLQTERYLLIPPTGMRDNLYPDNFNIASFIPKMNNQPIAEPTIDVYGPHGPVILTATPPWEKSKLRGKNKNNQRKFNKVAAEIQSGKKLKNAMKSFKYLPKARKRKIKQQLQQFIPE